MIKQRDLLLITLIAFFGCEHDPAEPATPGSEQSTETNSNSATLDKPGKPSITSDSPVLNLEYQSKPLRDEEYLQDQNTATDNGPGETSNKSFSGLLSDEHEKPQKNLSVKPLISEELEINHEVTIKDLTDAVTGAEITLKKNID